MAAGDIGFGPSSFLGLSLLLGAPVLGLGVFFLRQRLLARKAPAASPPSALGCVALLAGAMLFTFVGPPILLAAPAAAIAVGGLFLLRALTLVPPHGRMARQRLMLLVGVSLYWLLYWAYETEMKRWSQEVSGAIRLDIVAFFPLLFLVGAAGVWLSFDRWSCAEETTGR